MPVDKFGRMDGVKTGGDGASLSCKHKYMNIFLRKDGTTTVTGTIDMAGNTLFNVSNPVNPHNVVIKDYTYNIKGSGWVRKKQDGTYAIKRDLDMNNKKTTKQTTSCR